MVWTVHGLFGALLWLTNAGIGTHPNYRLALMFAALSWCGYVAWVPRSH